jgi:putative ABC transport system ATP-binding protein
MKLVIDDLTIAYRGAAQTVRPVEGLDLSIESGELVLLHGPSGCGKTTLLSAIAGLLTPESGSIRFGDSDVVGLGRRGMRHHRRRQVGMVFQSFNLIPSLTAVENVAVAMIGVPHREARRRARHVLTELGLGERLGHRPGQLSGGQQQRVAIARALANDPAVLLADEPTAHLDHSQIESVRSMMRSIADAGTTVIISTHDDRLGEVADRVVLMTGSDTGRPVAPGEAPKLELV